MGLFDPKPPFPPDVLPDPFQGVKEKLSPKGLWSEFKPENISETQAQTYLTKTPLNIRNTISQDVFSLLRTNRYKVELSYKGKTINHILCESVEFPESGIARTEYQIGNRPIFLIPYTRNYGSNTINITFRENYINNSKPEVLSFLENWANDIVTKDIATGSYNVNYYDRILGNMKITAMDLNYNPIINMEIYNIYPTLFRPSTLEYGDMNNYIKINTTFAFEEFELK